MDGFDEQGVAVNNLKLRRVTELPAPEETFDPEPHGIWIPLDAGTKTFRMRVEEPGVVTVEILEDGTWGIEWIQDA